MVKTKQGILEAVNVSFCPNKNKVNLYFYFWKSPKSLPPCILWTHAIWTFFSGTRTVANNILQISRGSTKVIQSATDAKRPNHKLLWACHWWISSCVRPHLLWSATVLHWQNKQMNLLKTEYLQMLLWARIAYLTLFLLCVCVITSKCVSGDA